MRPEIDPRAVGEVADGGSRRQNDSFEEIDIEAETAIAVKGDLAGAENADEGGHNPQHVAKPVGLLPARLRLGSTSKAPPPIAIRGGSAGEPNATCAAAGNAIAKPSAIRRPIPARFGDRRMLRFLSPSAHINQAPSTRSS